MLCDSYFKNPGDVSLFLEKIRKYSDRTGPVRLMEICSPAPDVRFASRLPI